MFFDQISQIEPIARKISCSIFVVPDSLNLKLPTPLYLRPDESKTSANISVEQIREFLSLTNNRETLERFFIITPAEAMNEAAQNAFLKTFEEPKPHCHFVLLSQQPNLLLPTIRSRAPIFYLKNPKTLDQPPQASPKVLATAKTLISTPAKNLPKLAADLTKSKTKPRQQTLEIVSTAIELLYKSYFKTSNPIFLTKLPQFLQLYDNLSNNGHIKLHLVANLC